MTRRVRHPAAVAARIALVDLARGLALLAMFAYHFCFDLVSFGLLAADPYQSPLWIAARTLILSSFLALVGVSLALSAQRGVELGGHLARAARIAACAVLVSAGSYLMFPQSWIWFGVLHHIAVASLLALPFLRCDRANLWFGAGLIAAGVLVQSPVFDQPALQWVGWMTHKPVTEDYVPLMPWFGVVLVGLFLGRRIAAAPQLAAARAWRPTGAPSRVLALAGRHSLLLYLVHQPVFIGAIWLAVRVGAGS